MKRLADILAGLTGYISVARPVSLDAVVADVQLDSRCVTPGVVFVALAGAAEARAAHIAQARAAGAIAVIGPPAPRWEGLHQGAIRSAAVLRRR